MLDLSLVKAIPKLRRRVISRDVCELFSKDSIVLNVKFEALTYQAQPTDFSVGCVSGPQVARPTSPQGVVGPASIFDLAVAFWTWMGGYVMYCLSALPKREASLGQHIVLWPSPKGYAAPICALRVSRSLARRLRRLRTRGYDDEDDFNLLRYQKSTKTDHLSPTQYLEWMIRIYRWGRTKIYGLNLGRAELLWLAVSAATLQGPMGCLQKSISCAAPLSPD